MWPSFRGLRWSGVLSLGILFVACGIVAALAHVAVRMAAAAISGTSIGWDALFADTLDTNNLYIPLFLAAFLLIEAVQNGWRNSAFRRVLWAGDTSTYTDIVYCCAALTRLVPVIASVSTLGLNALVKKYETGPGLAFFADLSLWFAIPGVLLVQSFVGYWLHRLMHSPLLWPMHAVHHAATDFNVITALRHHPTEGVVATLALPLVPALLGFPVEAIVIVDLQHPARRRGLGRRRRSLYRQGHQWPLARRADGCGDWPLRSDGARAAGRGMQPPGSPPECAGSSAAAVHPRFGSRLRPRAARAAR